MTFDEYAAGLKLAFVPISSETKRPYHMDWTNREFADADFRDGDNIGAKWGEPSGGICDVDLDTILACRAGELAFTEGPRYGRAGKRSSHVLVRSHGAKTKQFVSPFPGADGKKPMIAEIRSTGSQSVLPVSVHPSGERYEWERYGEPIIIDPAHLETKVGEVAAAALIASIWTGARHKFALALAAYFVKRQVPKDRAERLIHFVVHAAQDDEGADRLRAVRETYAKFANGDEISANLSPFVSDVTAFVKTLDAWLDIRQRRFKIHNEQTLLSRPAAAFLVSGLLVKGSLISLIADPNVGKTFLATDLTFSIAAGSDTWLGKRLHAAGPVLYVIGEGLGRFGYRLLAWKHTRGVDRSLPFHWIDEPVPLLDDDAATAFVREVAPLKPSLVVFDTLSRCLMGGNENSQEDMGKAVAVCDELRARTGCAVMVVHHTRKDGTVERGSTVLRGAADTLLMLKEETRGILTLSCEKQKDADQFEPVSLVRRSIQLDGIRDMSGEPASSCVIDVATGADTERAERQKKSRVLTFVREHPGTTRDDVCKALGGRRESVRVEIRDLIASGEIREAKGERNHKQLFEGSRKFDDM
jgi:hypothetical protein